MAKVIITFKDNDDGSVTVTTDFEPPMNNNEQLMTNAQTDALGLLADLRSSENYLEHAVKAGKRHL